MEKVSEFGKSLRRSSMGSVGVYIIVPWPSEFRDVETRQ